MPIDLDTALLLRAIERYITTAIGGIAIYCGYRLFQTVDVSQEGTAQFSFRDQAKLILSHIGPGVFFALFGTAIAVVSVLSPLSLGPGGPDYGVLPSDPVSVRYMSDRTLDQEQAERIGLVHVTNSMAADEISAEAKEEFARGLNRLKLTLMWDVWSDDWGDRAAFAQWALGSRDTGPPVGTEPAVSVFLAGLVEE